MPVPQLTVRHLNSAMQTLSHETHFLYLGTLFNQILMHVPQNSLYESVREYTAGTQVFNRHAIFIPLHMHDHWQLVVVVLNAYMFEDMDTCCIIVIPSVSVAHSDVAECTGAIRRWLSDEWRATQSDMYTKPDLVLPGFTKEDMPCVIVLGLPSPGDEILFILHLLRLLSVACPRRISGLTAAWFSVLPISDTYQIFARQT